MTGLGVVCAFALVLASPLVAQITLYGSPTPFNFNGVLDSGGQIPFAGNSSCKLVLHNHANQYGGVLGLAFGPGLTQVGAAQILVDLNGLVVINVAPGVTQLPLPVPNIPGIAGFSGAAQFGVIDPGVLGGFGLSNGVFVQILPNRTPTRACIPGQDFSSGSTAPGQMCVLDLSAQPPVFRATGSVGFQGSNGVNFPHKIAVAQGQHVAYALGNGATNQIVRAFDISSDPSGVLGSWQSHLIGDIPTAGAVGVFSCARDLEVTENGNLLFAATGTGNVTLEVFNTSSAPTSVPSAPVQTIAFAGGASGACGLELSPNDDRLAVMMSDDTLSTIVIYNVAPQAPQPLSPVWFLTLGAFPGNNNPADLSFSPDGRLLFVSGPNGFFNVIDTTASPPLVLVGLGTWPATPGTLWYHGSAVAVQNGAPVGIVANEGNAASYHLVDLNSTSPTFGGIVGSFTTNPGGNGNVSNQRIHARQNVVVAVDASGSVTDAEFVDVIDLNQPIPGGYASWRVKMPSTASLAPIGNSCIPRDFDLY